MKTLFRAIAMLLAVMILAGCATAYQKRGPTGGYVDKKLDDSHYVVIFDGNGFADKDRVWYFWLYRCAQLTTEKGYTYFSLEPIVDNMKKTGFIPDDDQGHLTDTVLHGDADGQLVDVRGGGVSYIYIPGGTITTWHSRAVVAMYGGDIPEQKMVLHAQSVMDALAEYIRTDGKSLPPGRAAIFDASSFGMTTDHQLVNIHQYMLAHPQAVRSKPRHVASPIDQYNVSEVPALPNGPVIAATTPPPPEPPSRPRATRTPAVVDAPAAPVPSPSLSAAQATASQMGCSDVQASGNGTFTAQCSSNRVLIACDGGQCRPQHAIR